MARANDVAIGFTHALVRCVMTIGAFERNIASGL